MALTLITGLVYPLAMTGIAQALSFRVGDLSVDLVRRIVKVRYKPVKL